MPAEGQVFKPSFFTRNKDELALVTVDSDLDKGYSTSPPLIASSPKAAAWSPDGSCVAIVEQAKGILILYLRDGNDLHHPEVEVRELPSSSKNTQLLWWSPSGNFLVTHHPLASQADSRSQPNLLVWDKNCCMIIASFVVPKFDRMSKRCPLVWSPDEQVCCRVVNERNEYNLHILPGEDLNSAPLQVITEKTMIQTCWAPLHAGRSLIGRLAVFCSDARDDMQRVKAPAEVRIVDIMAGDISMNVTARTSFPHGEHCNLLWSPSGTALLAQAETDVDETGTSYYGSTRLHLISSDGSVIAELNKDSAGSELPIQAVAWSPTSDEFILIRGFQPSCVTYWGWDSERGKVSQLMVLVEKAHRNTIKWSPFGNMVLLAGFGNCAGDMDVFGLVKSSNQNSQTLIKVSSSQANCTVSADWSTDGKTILTAVLFPRMRVENGFTVWDALSGKELASTNAVEELVEVSWRPTQLQMAAPMSKDIEKAVKDSLAQPVEPKKQAYRPPKGRDGGVNNVAAMMRGEMPVEHRRPKRQPQPRPDARDGEDQPRRDGFENMDRSRSEDDTHGAANGGGPDDQRTEERPPERSPPTQPPPAPPAQTGAAAQNNSAGPQQVRREIGSQQAAYQRHGEKLPCPPNGWQYIDPKGVIQGPFRLVEMHQWHSLGYFRPDLHMRCDPNDEFSRFDQLFPHPLIPFQSYPRKPPAKNQPKNNMFQ